MGDRRSGLAASVLAALGTAASSAAAQSPQTQVGVRVGVERIAGDYGSDVEVQDLYAPITLAVDRGRFGFRATVPYLEIEYIDPLDSSTYTESGAGDAVLGFTVFDAIAPPRSLWAVDATLKVKLATGDEARGLGSGEVDYTLLADLRRDLDRGSFIASAGYRLRGEPAAVTLEDGWLVSVGAIRRFTAAWSGSVFVDYRESSVPEQEAIREVSASLVRRIRDDWRLQGYVVRGLSDTTLDLATGFSVLRSF